MATPRQSKRDRAVELILGGRTHPEVAAEIGVRRETVWRWSQEPAFAMELSTGRRRRREQVNEALGAAAVRAVAVLASVMDDVDAPPGARIRAAAEVLDRAGVAPPHADEAGDDDEWVSAWLGSGDASAWQVDGSVRLREPAG